VNKDYDKPQMYTSLLTRSNIKVTRSHNVEIQNYCINRVSSKRSEKEHYMYDRMQDLNLIFNNFNKI